MDVESVEALSEEEEETSESIRQLQDALVADQLSRRAAPSSLSAGPSTPSTASAVLGRIESALAFNKLMDEKLQKLETILTWRLEECRQKIVELQEPHTDKDDKILKKFKYVTVGKPYFKDDHLFPAPDNSDTIVMKKSGMYDTSSIISICGWTIKDKRFFTSVIQRMSRDIAANKLKLELDQFEKTGPALSELAAKQISIDKQIAELDKKSLAELALPIDEEYEWDTISHTLNSRHSPQEYRALWRLFLHPSINKDYWSKDEKLRLTKIANQNQLQDWDKIAKELGTDRTGYQCFVYHRTNLENSTAGKKWSKEEEEYLKRVIEYYKEDNFVPWSKIASKMPNRTKMQIYTKCLQMAEKKGRFLREEDDVLLTCVQKYGPKYGKIAKILRGRTQVQLRRRYNLLSKTDRVSAVWSLDEDKRLLELMENQDDNFNFADLVQSFPGKTRVHIRTRYKTLVSWMKKHPRLDLAQAPRRGARRLAHGHGGTASLPGALENLKRRMTADPAPKPSKMSQTSSEVAIEDHIVTALINEEMSNTNMQETQKATTSINYATSDLDNIKRLLLLMRASLNQDKFKKSRFWRYQHPELLADDCRQVAQPTKVVSYSRKERPLPVVEGTVDVWGRAPLPGASGVVLPPGAALLTPCRRLMALAAAGGGGGEVGRRGGVCQAAWTRLLDRFVVLFTWPLLLSNEYPAALLGAPPPAPPLPPPRRIPRPSGQEKYVPPAVVIPVLTQKQRQIDPAPEETDSIDLIPEPTSEDGQIDPAPEETDPIDST